MGTDVVRLRCVAVAVGALFVSSPLGAQAANGGDFTVGVSAGLFADYPSDFAGGSCEEHASGLTALVRRTVSSKVSLEAGATVTSGIGVATCAFELLAPPRDGELYDRTSLDDAIIGQSFFATNLSAVVDPLATHSVGPRFRVGAGRLWGKRLWTWVYGAGVGVRVGANSIVLDVDRWNLGYDLRRELLIFREDGADELQSVETLRRSPRPWLLRIGWERRIG